MAPASISNAYLDNQAYLDCSQETAARIDGEVKKLLDRCYEESKELLQANRELLDQIAQHLLLKETITGEELMAFLPKEA
jgi:cell division protease FtsH